MKHGNAWRLEFRRFWNVSHTETHLGRFCNFHKIGNAFQCYFFFFLKKKSKKLAQNQKSPKRETAHKSETFTPHWPPILKVKGDCETEGRWQNGLVTATAVARGCDGGSNRRLWWRLVLPMPCKFRVLPSRLWFSFFTIDCRPMRSDCIWIVPTSCSD